MTATGVDKLTGEKVTETLTADEAVRSEQLEQVVYEHVGSFIEAGNALAEIKDRKLWRNRATSFANFVAYYWPEIGASQAYRLMAASAIVAELADTDSPTGETPLPTKERVARALTKLKNTDKRQAAWAEAVARSDGAEPTAAVVEEVVAEALAAEKAKAPKKSAPPPADEPDPDEIEDPDLARQREQAASRRQAVAEKATKYVSDLLLLDVALIDLRTVGRVERWCASVREAQEAP
jgi:hypothetical protein